MGESWECVDELVAEVVEERYEDLVILGFLFWVLLCLYRSCRRNGSEEAYQLCQKKLTKLEQQKAEAKAKKFKTLQGSCPICLEDLTLKSEVVCTPVSFPSGVSSAAGVGPASAELSGSVDEPVLQEVCTPRDSELRCRIAPGDKFVEVVGEAVLKTYDSNEELEEPMLQSPRNGAASQPRNGNGQPVWENNSGDAPIPRGESSPGSGDVKTAVNTTNPTMDISPSDSERTATDGSTTSAQSAATSSCSAQSAATSSCSSSSASAQADDEEGSAATDSELSSVLDKYENIKILSCGHVFHVNCLDGWERNSTLCPVCKQPQAQTVDEHGRPLHPPVRTRGWAFGERMIETDYRFRLMRLRTFYPDSLMSAHSGTPLSNADSIRTPSAAPSGISWSSGMSFGGGSSFGGGGSGGSW